MLKIPFQSSAHTFNIPICVETAVAAMTVRAAFIAYIRADARRTSFPEGAGYVDETKDAFHVAVAVLDATRLMFESSIDAVIWAHTSLAYKNRLHRGEVIFAVYKRLSDEYASVLG